MDDTAVITITDIQYMDLSKKNLIVSYTDTSRINDTGSNECTFSFNIDDCDDSSQRDSLLKKLAIEYINTGVIVPRDPSLPGLIESYIIRSHRDELLKETDKYFIISDMPIKDSDEYIGRLKEYRQALRDIPQQEGFPENVVWPEKPNI